MARPGLATDLRSRTSADCDPRWRRTGADAAALCGSGAAVTASRLVASAAGVLLAAALPMAAGQLPDGLRERAEQGDAAAQADLGRRYYVGEGVAQDDAEAARWTRLAADQGHAPAQYSLGLLYYRGRGVTGDDAAAARWYRAAAEQGHPPAQAALSDMYTYGAGVEEDPVLASMWIELAWRASLDGGGWRLYALQRAELASRVTAEQTAAGRRLARDWTSAPER